MGCPSPAELAELAGGRLPAPRRLEVSQHVEGCGLCASALFRLQMEGRHDSTTGEHGTIVPPSEELPRGANIDRYVVLHTVGHGGMGVVYAAFDPELDRRVAVKLVVTSALHATPQELLQEAQAMARLSHPNVVAVHDAGTLPDQRVFIAMELIDGRTLHGWLRERARSWSEVVEVFRQAGTGLAAAHAAGLVHRDFKPDNVLIGHDGRARVVDFGIARGARQKPNEQSSGPVTAVVGTAAYLSPEVRRGLVADARSDQYAYGVTLYQALFGRLPRSLEGRHLELPVQPRLPSWLRALVSRLLAREPQDRFASMDEVLAELSRDRYATRRRLGVGAAVVLSVLGAVGASQWLAARASRLCEVSESALGEAWSPSTQRAAAAAFAQAGAGASSDWARVEDALERYALQWRQMRREACRATRVEGTQSDEVLSLRMACLDRRREELGALTALFAHTDTQVVTSSAEAVQSLSRLQGCADLAALRARVRPPGDEPTRLKVEAARRLLARAKVLTDADKLTEGAALARTVRDQARALHYRPLEAEALFQLGKAELSSGVLGEEDLVLAYQAGVGSGEDDVALQAALVKARHQLNAYRIPDGALWLGMAEAVLERLERPRQLQVDFLFVHSLLRYRQGRFAEVLETSQRVERELEAAGETDSLRVAAALNAIAVTQSELGNSKASREATQRSVDIRRRIYGPQSSEVALMTLNASEERAREGDFAAAKALARDGLATFQRLQDAYNLPLGLATLGQAERGLGELGAAAEHLQDALERTRKVSGARSVGLTAYLLPLASVRREQGRLADAERLANEALALQEAQLAADDPALCHTWLELGLIRQAQKKPGAAALLESALRTSERATLLDNADTRLALARTLREERREPARVHTLATEARALYQQRHRPELAQEADVFLAGAR